MTCPNAASLPPEGPEDKFLGIVMVSMFVLLFAVIMPGLVILTTQAKDLLS